jgi:hypothetical protein
MVRNFLLLGLSILILGCSGNHHRPPKSQPGPPDEQAGELSSINLTDFVPAHGGTGANGTALSALIRNQKDLVVPARIYHAGKREDLLKNIPSISESDWNEYIVGPKTRYPLKSCEKGFYGSAWLQGNIYGNGDDPWFIEVSILNKCRKPQVVASLIDIDEDSRFIHWFGASKGKFTSLSVFKGQCARTIVPKDDDCDPVLDQFLNEVGIKIVYDDKYLDIPSFYIRDRSCIKVIKGSASEILEMARHNPMIKESAGLPIQAGGMVQETIFNVVYDHPELISQDFLSEMGALHGGVWQELSDAIMRCKSNGFDRLRVERLPPLNPGDLYRDAPAVMSRSRFVAPIDFQRICHPPTH